MRATVGMRWTWWSARAAHASPSRKGVGWLSTGLEKTWLSTMPYRVEGGGRIPESAVREDLLSNGPIVLEISAQLRSVDARGVATDSPERSQPRRVRRLMEGHRWRAVLGRAQLVGYATCPARDPRRFDVCVQRRQRL